MASRRRGKAVTTGRRLLLADAGMLAGFRRATASLDQMDEALHDLQSEGLEIVVLADSGLRRDLADQDQDRFEQYRGDGTVTCAAAGSEGGHTGFMRAVAERACRNSRFDEVLVLTARDLGKGGWTLARLGQVDGHWSLLGATPPAAT